MSSRKRRPEVSKLVRVSERGTVSLGKLAKYEYYTAQIMINADGVEAIVLVPVSVTPIKKEK